MSIKKLFDITVFETENFEVNQDWEIPIPGFFILAPKRKVKSITDFSLDESHELIDTLRKIREAMKAVLRINEVSIFQEERTEFNFHIWILPHYDWMDKIKTDSLKEIWRYAKENMADEKNIKEVKEAAEKVKKCLAKN
jgi:diadenosine tetraphosphate (Ap4A) HIT family hydrolase